MKRFLGLIALVVIVAGCSSSDIEILNIADGGVYFVFRGEEHYVASKGSIIIEKVPDGTFTYSTTYIIPDSISSSKADEDLGGTMSFSDHSTDWKLIYSSTYSIGDSTGNIYEIHLVKSSNQSIAVDSSKTP